MNAIVAPLVELARNPVLRRELDERAASKRAAVAMSLWLVLLAGLAALVYYASVASGAADPVTNDSASLGKDIFEWTLFGMMGLVLFLVPAFTASAVAGERTRQTLIPVQMTTLGPRAIVLGKALAAIAFTVLLVVASAPILAVAFFVGGVGITDLLAGLGMVLLTAVMLGAVGIMLSAVFSRVQGAIVMTYGFVLALALGTFIALGVAAIISAVNNANDEFSEPPAPPKELLIPNPFAALADATGDPDEGFASNPLTGIRTLVRELDNQSFANAIRPGEAIEDREVTALWRWYVVFAVLVTYSSIHVATERLRTPAETER